jgi:hypothetical protein
MELSRKWNKRVTKVEQHVLLEENDCSNCYHKQWHAKSESITFIKALRQVWEATIIMLQGEENTVNPVTADHPRSWGGSEDPLSLFSSWVNYSCVTKFPDSGHQQWFKPTLSILRVGFSENPPLPGSNQRPTAFTPKLLFVPPSSGLGMGTPWAAPS